jgi:hypothetical protein
MHRELRAWNSDIPESPERLDPILKIILQLYAGQLARIDRRIDQVWDVAKTSLIRSLCPECKRWPVPAYTIMCCQPADPVVEIDPHTRFYYREKREGGQTFFFSALRNEKITNAQVKHIYLRAGSSIVDLSPATDDPQGSVARRELGPAAETPSEMYVAVDYGGDLSNLKNAAVFFQGSEDVTRQLRWAYWSPSAASGRFYEDTRFCPGLSGSIEELTADPSRKPTDWGGMRTDSDLFKQLENSFAVIPESFAGTWEMSPVDPELRMLLESRGMAVPAENDRFYWIRMDLPPGGRKDQLISPLKFFFNAFIATNRNEMVLFKHTGGNRVVEIELPDDIKTILRITSVVDSNGRNYYPRHEVQASPSLGSYSLDERGDKLMLWFDFSSSVDLPPDSLTVNYTTTAGVDANGIEPGKISELYESHPGVLEARNITPTTGAIPAKTTEQIVNEVSTRLRCRDRALSFSEIANWAAGFDPRIKHARCQNGIERTTGGVRRCVVVSVNITAAEFHCEEELDLLRTRLGAFLKSRAPVNTQFRVEITKA